MTNFKFDAWPTEFRSINHYFGVNPQYYGQFGLPGHEGVDIHAPTGSRIFAVAPGRITRVRNNPNGHNYGIHVQIDHIENYQTIYAHMKEARVRVGQTVVSGQTIGLANDTGNSFGSHLHLTLKKKNATYKNWPFNIFDPTPYLLPLLGIVRPAGPYTEGWAFTSGITAFGELAQVNATGINLRQTPSVYGRLIDLVPAGTILIVNGNPRGQYTPVLVATASLPSTPVPEPPPPPPPPGNSNETVDGWGFEPSIINRVGNQGTVAQFGIKLRAKPNTTAHEIGVVRENSTVTITGGQQGQYLPVRVRRSDFSSAIDVPGEVMPPPITEDTILGWAFTNNLTINDKVAMSGRFGTNLRTKPNTTTSQIIGLFAEGTTGRIAGLARGDFTPIRVARSVLQNISIPNPVVEMPDPIPGEAAPPTPPPSTSNTTPGYAFTTQITVEGGNAFAGPWGIKLRGAPHRDGKELGFVAANQPMIITGGAQGEYTPVRVSNDILEPPFGTAPTPTPTQPAPIVGPPPTEPQPLGSARIGLHASADPFITDQEVGEFKKMRPGMIKVLSFHDPNGVQKLVNDHPDARWVVRAFLDFRSQSGVRNIPPAQFVNDTLSDVKRTLNIIGNKDVVVELHNEPNLVPEGMTGAWSDGATFATWWLDVLNRYRQALPGMRFIYPGLSPGGAVNGIKEDHIRFIEASRTAVEAADGLAIHTYWSNVYPMSLALGVLDDYINRFRYKQIWITEASNNKAGTSTFRKAQEYLDFWKEIQKRPTVQGVTYFVASASDPAFAEEVWVGRGIAARVGRR